MPASLGSGQVVRGEEHGFALQGQQVLVVIPEGLNLRNAGLGQKADKPVAIAAGQNAFATHGSPPR